MLELLEIAHSQSAPRGRPGAFQYYLLQIFPCGSGLARESGVSAIAMLTDTAPSRASPLPHWI
ncbi:hypothetical protein EMIT0347P_160017 [Pseudomonas sp. IT-347P]